MLFIHIGAHKCGSSSIQQFMSLNAETLQGHGALYPYVGGSGRAHHILAQELNGERPSSQDFQAWTALRKFTDSHPDENIVLSSEVFETLPRQSIAEIRSRLPGVPVMILAYIRETAETLPSRYSQLTKHGINILDFDEFYARHKPGVGRVGRKFEKWADVFGWESLRIRSLDERSLTGGTLIDDFLSVFDLSLSDLGSSDVAGLVPANVSPGWKAVELLRALFAAVSPEVDRDTDNPKRVRRDLGLLLQVSCLKIMSDLGHGSGRAQYLTARQKAECDAAYAEGIEWLNTKIAGPKLPQPLFAIASERPFLPGLEHIPARERVAIGKRLAKRLRARRERLDGMGISSDMQQHLIELVRNPVPGSDNAPEPKGRFGARPVSRIRAAWTQARQQLS